MVGGVLAGALGLGCGSTLDVQRTQGGTPSGAAATLPECSKETEVETTPGAGSMVRAGRLDGACFWMDEHEVTVSAYSAFLKATASWEAPAECPADADHLPHAGCSGASADDMARTCVDWCDAAAFCHWAGMRLCGGPGPDFQDARTSDWFSACSDGGPRQYPYADTFDAAACNVGSGGPWPADGATARTTCRAASGVRDLIGNVAEWVNEGCGDGQCLTRGGSFLQGGRDITCGASQPSLPITSARADTGFRCCAP